MKKSFFALAIVFATITAIVIGCMPTKTEEATTTNDSTHVDTLISDSTKVDTTKK